MNCSVWIGWSALDPSTAPAGAAIRGWISIWDSPYMNSAGTIQSTVNSADKLYDSQFNSYKQHLLSFSLYRSLSLLLIFDWYSLGENDQHASKRWIRVVSGRILCVVYDIWIECAKPAPRKPFHPWLFGVHLTPFCCCRCRLLMFVTVVCCLFPSSWIGWESESIELTSVDL